MQYFVPIFSFAIISLMKRELAALLSFSSWRNVAVIILTLFLVVSWVGLQCVVVAFPGHIHLSFITSCLVVTIITGYSCDFLFNCTTVSQASGSMTNLAKTLNLWDWCLSLDGHPVALLEVYLALHMCEVWVFVIVSSKYVRLFQSDDVQYKPVLSGHSKIDKTKILMTYGSLMKVESIAECSHNFDLH